MLTLTLLLVIAGPKVPEWVTIEGGSFTMGSEVGDPDEQHLRQLILPTFEISKTEVTVAQYGACVRAKRCHRARRGRWCNAGLRGRGDYPINCVSWYDAKRFARWVGAALPSESQWEFAARSRGEERSFPWGDQAATCALAVMDDGAPRGCGQERSWPVCSRSGGNTRQGLCDMAGNVWEWVEDRYVATYQGAPVDGRPRRKVRTNERVRRGGCFNSKPAHLRTTNRAAYPARARYPLGFRLVRSP